MDLVSFNVCLKPWIKTFIIIITIIIIIIIIIIIVMIMIIIIIIIQCGSLSGQKALKSNYSGYF